MEKTRVMVNMAGLPQRAKGVSPLFCAAAAINRITTTVRKQYDDLKKLVNG